MKSRLTPPVTIVVLPALMLSLAIRATSQEMPSQNARTVLAVGSVIVTPVDPTVVLGGTIPFAAQVVGHPGVQVLWTVNGVAGGTKDTGWITGSGLYTAPATMPDNAPKITATSPIDSTQSMSVSVTINVASCPPTDPAGNTTPCLRIEPPTSLIKVGAPGVRLSLKSSNWPSTATGMQWSVNGVNNGTPATGTIQGAGTDVHTFHRGPQFLPRKSR